MKVFHLSVDDVK